MQVNGSVTLGGTMFGACIADIKTADNHSYHFKGYFGEVGTPNVGYGTNFTGDFPGLDHIEGSCWFEVAAASVGPGGCQLTFWDSHGQIGTLIGQIFGGGFDVGLGGGSWNDEEWKATKNQERIKQDFARNPDFTPTAGRFEGQEKQG